MTQTPVGPAIHFLHSLSQALATCTLYAPSHPARQRTIKSSYEALRILQSHDDTPSFSLIGRDVIYGFEVLRDLRDWEWATRLAAVGVQRIEVASDVALDEYEIFIGELHARLSAPPDAPVSPLGPTDRSQQAGIRYGAIGIQGAVRDGGSGPM